MSDFKDAMDYQDWAITQLKNQRDELRDLCVLLFDAVKYGNQVVDLPGIWNKAKEVLSRTDPEDKP